MLDIIIKVLDKLNKSGYEAYLVGGFVRDYYLGINSKDIDICTNAKVNELAQIFTNIISKNEDCGSIVINYNNLKMEITSFRKDIKYKNNRKPIIECVETIEEDVLRRDFTINSLYMNKNKDIIDLVSGKIDIDNKVIKVVGNTSIKIKEDALRILRAVRFATTLNFKLDGELRKEIVNNKLLLLNLSYERKKEELNKIFNSSNNKYGIGLLLDLDLADVLGLSNLDNVIIEGNAIGIWAQLNTTNYPFTKEEQREMDKMKKLFTLDITNLYIIYKYGLRMLKIVSDIKQIDYSIILSKYNSLKIKSREEINIKFNDIKEILGIDNKSISKIYDEIELQIIYNRLNNDLSEIKDYIINKYKEGANL